MAFGASKDGETSEKQQEQQKKNWGDYAELAANWIVDIISIPVSFCGYILASFLTPGSSGTKILAAIFFFGGVFVSADGIWQVVFQGTPLFPWFERTWIGWIGWLTIPFNIWFWVAVAMSALIQIMEAKTLRGKRPDQAKTEFEASKVYTLGAKPTGNIDLTKALWGDYKRAGMRERHTGGLIALFFWTFDLTTTFVSRNPFDYSTEPGGILACLAFNLVTMFAGEIGYSIWKLNKR